MLAKLDLNLLVSTLHKTYTILMWRTCLACNKFSKRSQGSPFSVPNLETVCSVAESLYFAVNRDQAVEARLCFFISKSFNY